MMQMTLAARRAAVTFPMVQQRNFTRAFRKIVLTDDVPHLGFKGEICFVKPGHALNHLVPNQKALFFSDPASNAFLQTVNL